MNAIAQVLHARGYRVSGSERLKDQGIASPLLELLERQEISVYPQDGSAISGETGAVIVSSAIEPDNPDLESARARGVQVWHRAEALAALIGTDRCIAIAGTSGKSTITGMVGWLMTELGKDPCVVNGGAVLNWKSHDSVGNVRMGASDLWVVEVDESDRSLLQFHPDLAVISNISRDHFPLADTIGLFGAFAGQVSGEIVCGSSVRHQLAKVEGIKARLLDVPPVDEWRGALLLPGRHNRENAQLAVTLCETLGLSREQSTAALARFRGIERRLEYVGAARGVRVTDDYAHNPAKIHAAWTAISEHAARVIGVWRPHGYGPLASMADDLVEMFQNTCRPHDQLYVLPVYYAGGTANRTMNSETFVERLLEMGVPADFMPGYEELEERIMEIRRGGDSVLCMGARDPGLPVFARQLLTRLASD